MRNIELYSKLFSRIYNEFGWNYYPEAFAGQLLAWLSRKMPHAQSVLDLGCGTGVLCRILRANGLSADGVDLSANMIEIARKEDPEGWYETEDMTIYEPRRKYDIVTCTGDAINHLTDIILVERTIDRVRNCIEDGGYFVFDLLNENEVADPEPIEFDYDEKTRASFLMEKDSMGIVTLTVSVKENGVEVLQEVIRERLYDAEEICGLLKKAGFREVEYSHRLLEDGAEVPTWYVTARM